MRKFIRRHIAFQLLLPLLFTAYMGSISLFPHAHIIDGCKIVHSHPFADDGHSHDGDSARTILILSTFSIDGEIMQGRLPLPDILPGALPATAPSPDASGKTVSMAAVSPHGCRYLSYTT